MNEEIKKLLELLANAGYAVADIGLYGTQYVEKYGRGIDLFQIKLFIPPEKD